MFAFKLPADEKCYEHHVCALQVKQYHPSKHYTIYNLLVNATIDGKKVKMLLDTGADISEIGDKTTHSLHLDKLSQSKTLKKLIMSGPDGGSSLEKAVDVAMSIENSTTFHTSIQLNNKESTNLLSIHDLMKAFSS
jgi:hypothetical protein